MKKNTYLLLIVLLFICSSTFSQVILDPTFGIGGKVVTSISLSRDIISGVVLQGDKILTCGMANVGSNYVNVIVRYNNDGSLDTTFGTNGIVTTNLGTFDNYKTNSIKIQNDGKIIIAGSHEDGSFNFVFMMTRYTINGILDTSFGTNGIVLTDFSPGGVGGAGNGAKDIAIQSDNKIILAGYGSGMNNTYNDYLIARYNADGTLDNSFGTLGKTYVDVGIATTSGGFPVTSYEYTNAVKVQSDGKIIIAGYSDAGSTADTGGVNDQNNLAITRLNVNGTIDTSFGTNGRMVYDFGGNDKEFNLMLTSDDKLIVSGTIFFNSDQNSKTVIAKFNNNGSIDTSFGTNGKTITQINTTLMQDDLIGSIVLQNDGKILVSGYSVNNTSAFDFLLMRFNSNGLLDTTFNTTGYITTDFNSNNDVSRAIAVQNDGKIILAGLSGISPTFDFALARYIDIPLSSASFEAHSFTIYPNPTSSLLTIFNPKNNSIESIEIYNLLGQLITSNQNKNNAIDVSSLESGSYFIKINAGNTSETTKFIKN